MIHDHGHHHGCSHTNIQYCSHCDVVYCTNCKREWGSRKNFSSFRGGVGVLLGTVHSH